MHDPTDLASTKLGPPLSALTSHTNYSGNNLPCKEGVTLKLASSTPPPLGAVSVFRTRWRGQKGVSQILVIVTNRHILRLNKLFFVLRNQVLIDLDLRRLGKLPDKLQ